jgi:uncharacterized protein (TIGR03382 family)
MWVDGDSPSPTGCEAELANTATHEIGHFLGLDHTCWDGTPPRRTDNNGDPVPRCSPAANLEEPVTEATMYNFQECGETKKKTLEESDIGFVCAVYEPLPPPEGGGCQSRPIGAPFGALLLVLALALGLPRRRNQPSL